MTPRESDTHDESQNTSDWSARKVIEVGLRIAERYRAQDMFQTIALTPAQGREVLAALAVPSIAAPWIGVPKELLERLKKWNLDFPKGHIYNSAEHKAGEAELDHIIDGLLNCLTSVPSHVAATTDEPPDECPDCGSPGKCAPACPSRLP